MQKITLTTLNKMKQSGEKITCLTAYDASFSFQLAEAGVEIILVGDSLGMVVQGEQSTVPVTMDDMAYHTQLVAKGNEKAQRQAFVIADMPYMSYSTVEDALFNAKQLMQAGGQMVKVEGGKWLSESILALTECGIPVCGHLGLTPQSVDALGGYKVQGRDQQAAIKIKQDVAALVEAGIRMLVLECVPTELAAEISQSIDIPVIGIGAGPKTDAQVLVIYDMLGISPRFYAKFVKNFMQQADDIPSAIKAYVDEVKNGTFPGEEHSFS